MDLLKPFQLICEAMSARNQKGFLAESEAQCLYFYALQMGRFAPILEVGSYCGKSTVFLGKAAAQNETVVFAVDHHRGSEEHQLGEEYHDADLFNFASNRFDSFPEFLKTLEHFQLRDCVVPVVASSQLVVSAWQQPLSMVFIDGGHSETQAKHDFLNWALKVMPHGILALHDIYPDPSTGGQAPLLALNALMDFKLFNLERKVGSLVLLRRNKKKISYLNL